MQNCSIGWSALVYCGLAITSLPALGADGLRTAALWPSPGFDISRTGLHPDLNDVGQISFSRPPFRTHWGSPDVDAADGFGIFLESSAGLQPLALPGEQAPETSPGVRFVGLGSTTALNNAGQHAFWTYLTGDGIDASNNNGIFTGDLEGLRMVAREGDAVPGHPELSFENVGDRISGLQLNDRGQVAFSAKLVGPEFDTHANVWGVFTEGLGNGLRMIARNRQQVPGQEEGKLFQATGGAQINDQGQTLFASALDVPGSTTRHYGLFLEDEAGLQLLIESGQTAPGTASGAQFDVQTGHVLNENGQVAFKSRLKDSRAGTQSPGVGIFRHADGEIAPVAITGQKVPGGSGSRFGDGFGVPVMNDLGQTAFTGNLFAANADISTDNAIFSEGGGEGVRIVALTGASPVQGVDTGVVFGSFYHGTQAINNLGQTAFTSTLRGSGVNETNDFGIFVESLDRGAQLVVRTGDQVDVSDDPAVTDLRTIREIGDGFWFDLNDAGEVAFSAEFTDGSYGVFVATTIPEPAADCAMLISLLLLTVVRRRRQVGLT